jgi:hypothetical protein
MSPKKLPTGEKTREKNPSTGAKVVCAAFLKPVAMFTPRKSKVIRKRDETSSKTKSNLERLLPPFAIVN